jgi:hypothetical protein
MGRVDITSSSCSAPERSAHQHRRAHSHSLIQLGGDAEFVNLDKPAIPRIPGRMGSGDPVMLADLGGHRREELEQRSFVRKQRRDPRAAGAGVR